MSVHWGGRGPGHLSRFSASQGGDGGGGGGTAQRIVDSNGDPVVDSMGNPVVRAI